MEILIADGHPRLDLSEVGGDGLAAARWMASGLPAGRIVAADDHAGS